MAIQWLWSHRGPWGYVCVRVGYMDEWGLPSQTPSRHPAAAGTAMRGSVTWCLPKPPAHGHPHAHTHMDTHTRARRHTALHRGNDQVQRILMCYFIWQIIEPSPCGLSEEFHPYLCLAFPVETNTQIFQRDGESKKSPALIQSPHSPGQAGRPESGFR